MRRAAAIVALALSLVAGACTGGGDDAEEATTTTEPAAEPCPTAPTTWDVREVGETPAGGEVFPLADAAIRRVAILPGADRSDPAALDGLVDDAGDAELAQYVLYLADYELPDAELASAVGDVVATPPGRTLGLVSIVPPTEEPLAEGQVIEAGVPEYETTFPIETLSLRVFFDGATATRAFTDVVGEVEVLSLDDEAACLRADVAVEYGGELVYAAAGTIEAPIVDGPPEAFLS